MPNYLYSTLSRSEAVIMEIEGQKFPVSMFSSSWAANEIPTAVLSLAVGRDVKTNKAAPAHSLSKYKSMTAAKVYLNIAGDYSLKSQWPEKPILIFDGFLAGSGFRKINGKVQLVIRLIHWLAQLGFSSALTASGHPANPPALNTAAVLQRLPGGGASEKIGYIANLPAAAVMAPMVRNDLWSAIKKVFCALANVEVGVPGSGAPGSCGGAGEFTNNKAALAALKRIEGPVPGFAAQSLDYRYGVPLKLEDADNQAVSDGIARSLAQDSTESYSDSTMWDKLIGQIFPQYQMAIVPQIDHAIVVADTPAYQGGPWRTIGAEMYDSLEVDAELPRPLRAVGVVAGWESRTGAVMPGQGQEGGLPIFGGCYSEDSVSPGDGAIQYVRPPAWLGGVVAYAYQAEKPIGVNEREAVKSATTPDAGAAAKMLLAERLKAASKLYGNYARSVYVAQALRGRSGSISGKLRFDIAPLSVIRVGAAPEKILGAGDRLTPDFVACVQRVVININAESGAASTAFAISHIRTDEENKSARTSTPGHPLFGESIHGPDNLKLHGAPLTPELEFPEDEEED